MAACVELRMKSKLFGLPVSCLDGCVMSADRSGQVDGYAFGSRTAALPGIA